MEELNIDNLEKGEFLFDEDQRKRIAVVCKIKYDILTVYYYGENGLFNVVTIDGEKRYFILEPQEMEFVINGLKREEKKVEPTKKEKSIARAIFGFVESFIFLGIFVASLVLINVMPNEIRNGLIGMVGGVCLVFSPIAFMLGLSEL